MVKLPATIEWSEAYSVGIREIDQQHKQLIGLINALDKLRGRVDRAMLERILTTLVEFTKRHFYEEEKMMAGMNYPQLKEHKAMHKAFIARINEFEKAFHSDQSDVSQAILDFLRTWLFTHILIHDKAYETYRLAHGIHA